MNNAKVQTFISERVAINVRKRHMRNGRKVSPIIKRLSDRRYTFSSWDEK